MVDFIRWLVQHFGYLGVFLLTLAETVFPPLPSEVIIPVAGLEAQRGAMSLPGVIAAGTAGTMAGNLFWYLLARRLGLRRFKPLVDRYGRWLTTEWRDIERGERYFSRHGALFVFVARLLPAIRTFISVPAGFAAMPIAAYVAWSTIGTAMWTGALAYAGWKLGEQFSEINLILQPLSVAIIAPFLGWYLWRLMRQAHGG
ncbi:MAG: DedA family protein [Alphaproteobacteria bacterium]|nr:DedA family protein [Alphaproteobacteria bacterium]